MNMRAFIAAAAERQRQIEQEGFTAERDDQYLEGELAGAAVAYAREVRYQVLGGGSIDAPISWPWAEEWWKPSEDPKRNIVKAMALLSAEYERLERAEAAKQPSAEKGECWSINDEEFRYSTLQDLLDAEDFEPGRIVYEGTPRPATATNIVSAESVIDNIGECAWDLVGEAADDYPDVTNHEKALLQSLIEAWLEHFCPITFYQVTDSREYVVTAEDLGDRLESAGQE